MGGRGCDYVLRSWMEPWAILRPLDMGSRFFAVTYTVFNEDPLKLLGPEYEEDARLSWWAVRLRVHTSALVGK